jgi:hypothetical protein
MSSPTTAAIGKPVTVTVRDPDIGTRTVHGVLTDATAHQLVLRHANGERTYRRRDVDTITVRERTP